MLQPPPAQLRAQWCRHQGCAHAAQAQCAYFDRRRVRCATWWCAVHGVDGPDGRPYCRRHAGTLQAIGGSGAAARPDVGSRAASLCGWVGRELDTYIRATLAQALPPSGAGMVVSAVYLPPAHGATGRRWQQDWKLLDNTSVLTKVTLAVDEARPTEVMARVGGEAVGSGVPPWIGGRGHGDATEARQREGFYDAIRRSIALALARPAAVVAASEGY